MKTGTTSFWNIWKGFGFVDSEDPGEPSVMVHYSALDGFPEAVAYLANGESVLYEAEPGDPAPDGSPRQRAVRVIPRPDRMKGMVEDYGFVEGRGTIRGEDGQQYFLHYSNILGEGMKDTEPGDEVFFVAGERKSRDGGHFPVALLVKLCDPRPHLHRFAEFPRDLKAWLDPLDRLAEDEDWDFHHELEGRGGYKPILRHYVEQTFVRLLWERDEKGRPTILETETSDGQRGAIFNTGLVTDEQEGIYAYLIAHRDPDSSTPYWWQGFYAASDRRLLPFKPLPEPADYLSDGGELFITPEAIKELRVDYSHIVGDEPQRERFPEHLRDRRGALRALRTDLLELPDRIRRNYKAAVPQLYRGKIQLLLPLDLGGEPGRQDLALVVEHSDDGYRANTVLGLDLAYRQSRLIARPDPEWLGRDWMRLRQA